MRYFLVLAVFLSSCAQIEQAPVVESPPAVEVPPRDETPIVEISKPSGMESTCPSKGVYQAVDASEPVTQKFLDVSRYLGVKTIIRYYDYVNETIRGKTPKASELALIKKNGFKVMMVFQHNNNRIASFTKQRGADDAKRTLELASLWSQPKGSAIYFGADGSFSSSSEQSAVKAYFEAARPVVKNASYKLGAYGSGATCKMLLDAGIVDYCWLANATGWSGYAAFNSSNKWVLKQSLPKDCGGINVDFDVVNGEFGDWSIP